MKPCENCTSALRSRCGAGSGACSASFLVLFLPSRTHDIDRSSVERSLDVRGVVFLDHLDTGGAVLGDLVDVCTLHQPQADVSMAQTVCGTWSAFAVKAQVFLMKDGLEEFTLPLGKNQIGWLRRSPIFSRRSRVLCVLFRRVHAISACRAEPASKSLKGRNRTGHTLAISDTALSSCGNPVKLTLSHIEKMPGGAVVGRERRDFFICQYLPCGNDQNSVAS